MKTELGGDRLGSGNKQEISMRNFERSTHDLGYTWRSSMSSGTLVPFMSELGLPGDSFDIDLNVDVKTLPTIGPLYGSYKVQLDVFQCPIRLYQGKLHMNMLNIGMDMSEVLLPQMSMQADYDAKKGDNQQINPSSIYSYLNMRGLGRPKDTEQELVERDFNAIPYLGYWDIYKQYYANKQEERGYVIHNDGSNNDWNVNECDVRSTPQGGTTTSHDINGQSQSVSTQTLDNIQMNWLVTYGGSLTDSNYGTPDVNTIQIEIDGGTYNLVDVFTNVQILGISTNPSQLGDQFAINCWGYVGFRNQFGPVSWEYSGDPIQNTVPQGAGEPELVEFPLTNIDDMRMDILEDVRSTVAFKVDANTQSPYGLGLGKQQYSGYYYKLASQEGLGIKTYQSDLFNNWISTEWIDGTNGINEVTAVSTAGNEFTIDALNLANKVYNMLNRIAISGGSYDDWLDAVYTHERAKGHENPIYQGSLIRELSFEEVISQADTEMGGNVQPLGTLAGRGRMTGKSKGGKIKVKVHEPSYIMGIVSITPRIDYSQGNKWDTNLESMNDLHKPSLDSIGFQSLIVDQMAWQSTEVNTLGVKSYASAGKQPAWINYMTNVNQTRGNFAVQVGEQGGAGEMFMTLNRRYETGVNGIEDLTTYIDPSKYNNIFAQTSLDSQNFWCQIRNSITARRKMSAKVIPNL